MAQGCAWCDAEAASELQTRAGVTPLCEVCSDAWFCMNAVSVITFQEGAEHGCNSR